MLTIKINGERKTENVLYHRLVALAFIENDSPFLRDTVDHRNGYHCENTIFNL